MIRRAWLLCAVLSVCPKPSLAQTRVYVAGDVFADVTRFSRTTGPDPASISRALPADGVTAGGGGRIGAFFSPAWSLELGVDVGTTQTDVHKVTLRPPIVGELPIVIRPLTYDSRSSIRFGATSVLIGYHPPARGRIRPGFRGGISVMHRREAFTTATSRIAFGFSSSPTGGGLVDLSSVTVDEYSTIANLLTATLAAETVIAASEHFSLVPELRMHAGGLGAIILRPGVSARWTF